MSRIELRAPRRDPASENCAQKGELSFHSLFHRGYHRGAPPAKVLWKPPSQRKQWFFWTLPESYQGGSPSCASDDSRAPQEPHRQQEQGAQQSKNAVNGDTHNAEWKKQQPNERIDHQSQQRERPAQNEQDNPQKKSSHQSLTMDRAKRFLLFATTKCPFTLHTTSAPAGKFPSLRSC